MNKFGIQYSDNSLEGFSEKRSKLNDQNNQHSEVREVLHKFQEGYTERNQEKVDEFMGELFVNGDEIYAVGTATGELFLGFDQVKDLIKSDWEYWGDVNINWENARIDIKDDTAFFASRGTVKYIFEDTTEKFDRHINFIKNKVEEMGLTPRQKITYMNWFLSLVYHQREDSKREYLWPVRLSGVMVKDDGRWKIVNLKFSMPKSNFPDERFENSNEFEESYKKHYAMCKRYNNNQMTSELYDLLKSLEIKFIGQEHISKELVSKYFAVDSMPYIIAPEDLLFNGVEEIKNFFADYNNSILSLDLEHAIASKYGGTTCVSVTGILNQNLSEDKIFEFALGELNTLFQANIPSKEKLFAAHRSIAYALKESATGTCFTYPIWLTAIVTEGLEGLAFQQIHFSFPFYWILEGKLDTI